MHDLLSGKNVFVTGAGANIGRAIALEMAAQGANLFFAEIDAARCADLEAELRANGTQTQGFISDISNPASIDKMVNYLQQQEIFIDVLVNNVGSTLRDSQATTTDFGRWQKTMETNVLGPLYLSRLLAQTMIERQMAGSILFITSIHQWVCCGDEVYSASKASLDRVIDELAVSLAPYGIRVNGIAPGSCEEQTDGTAAPHSGTPLHHEKVPPRYIGRAAVFLASDYFSHYTTGATLKIDGGLSLYSFANRHSISPIPVPAPRRWRQKLSKLNKKVKGFFHE